MSRTRTLCTSTFSIAALLAFAVAAPPSLAQPPDAPPPQTSPAPANPTLPALRDAAEAGDYRRAVELAESLAAQGEDSAELRSYWSGALTRLAELDRARAIATEGLAKFPDDAVSLVTMARVHLAFAELNEAGQSLYQAVRQDPRLAVAHLELGRLYEAERRMATAKRHYGVAFGLQPRDPSVLLAWSRTVADPTYRLNLLERYLELAAPGGDDTRRMIESTASVLRRAGNGGRCRLRGGAREATLKLQQIRPGPGDPDRFALKLTLDGKGEVRTLVDTGATGVIVSESYARAAGLENLGRTWLRGLGEEGWREGYFARAQTIAAQDLVYEDCIVEVVPDAVLANHTTTAVMGLDGLYRDFVITFDFGRSELGLSPLPPLPGEAEGRPDAWSHDRDVSALPAGFYPARVFGKDFIVPVIVNDKLQTYFLIDSGGFTTLISKRTAEEAGGVSPSSTRLLGLSGTVEQVWNADPLVLNVLGLAQRYEGMLAIDLDEYGASGAIGIDGLLGFSFLEHSVLTLDDRNGLVRIEMGRVVRRPSRR